MKIVNRIWIEFITIVLLCIFNFFIIENVQNLAREIYTSIFILTIPGIVIARMIRISARNNWYFFIISCGISVCFIYACGLLANFLIPTVFTIQPLSTKSLLYSFDIALSILLLISFFISHKTNMFEDMELPGFTDIFFIIFSTCMPVLSILGAIMLNNNGSNILIIILLCLMPLLLVGLVLFKNKLHDNTYYWYVFTASVSLLLMLSLRSSHILGSDINDEYNVFQLTKNQGFWNYALKNPYNACLSITILPTIIANFTHINDEYIYKVIMQVLFALTPVGLFTLYKNFTTRSLSVLAVFYVIAQPFFIQPMTGLIRQEVAFFFFILTLCAAFGGELKQSTKNGLFIIFGMALVVSHYSTAYLSVFLFTISFICIAFINAFNNHVLVRKIYKSITAFRFDIQITHSIQALPLFIIIITTYFWYFQFTQTSGNLVKTFTTSVTSFGDVFSSKKRNDEQLQALSFSQGNAIDSQKVIDEYNKKITNEFSQSTIPKYTTNTKLYPIHDLELHPKIPRAISSPLTEFLNIIRDLTKVIIFLSPFLLLFKYIHKEIKDKEYITFTIIGLSFVVLVILHPGLGDAYNVSRIYLQILMIAAICGIVFLFDVQFCLPHALRLFIISIILIFMFALHTGLSAELIGGISHVHLNNFGSDYDKFYVHEEEVAGARWLNKNHNTVSPVYVDIVSGLRLTTFSKIKNKLQIIIPAAMFKDSYVYAGYSNIKRLRTDAVFSGLEVVYSFPIDFLHTNKNLVYNNGGTQIYR